jgi:hypothetical protein
MVADANSSLAGRYGGLDRLRMRLSSNVRPFDIGRVSSSVEWRSVMTDLLEKAIQQISKLPAEEQDAVAALLLEEMASEERWAALFARSEDVLEGLANEALSEHRAGLTKPL